LVDWQEPTALFQNGDKIPYLLINGVVDEHRISAEVVTQEIQPHFTNFTRVDLKDSGHAFWYDDYEGFRDAVFDWTERL
jgi:pimeloyl-ACP methyl ester carboxylesterase